MESCAFSRLSAADCTCLLSSVPESCTMAVFAATVAPSLTQTADTVPLVVAVTVCWCW